MFERRVAGGEGRGALKKYNCYMITNINVIGVAQTQKSFVLIIIVRGFSDLDIKMIGILFTF